MVSHAKTNAEIARELGITKGSVKEYVYRICRRKLDLKNRTELALWVWGVNLHDAERL